MLANSSVQILMRQDNATIGAGHGEIYNRSCVRLVWASLAVVEGHMDGR